MDWVVTDCQSHSSLARNLMNVVLLPVPAGRYGGLRITLFNVCHNLEGGEEAGTSCVVQV